ncbi:MAG: glutaredoxin [Clostridia bacterium]|jgi:thioredoxin 1|nr:glutaredoxin [Clostridia bacterium]
MKQVILFIIKSCPYCIMANKFMKQIFKENPQFKDVPLRIVDENEQKDIADQYNYYYVPTYYVDGVRMHEGVPTKEKVEAVFKAAYAGE